MDSDNADIDTLYNDMVTILHMLQRIKQSPSAVLILLLNRIGHLVLRLPTRRNEHYEKPGLLMVALEVCIMIHISYTREQNMNSEIYNRRRMNNIYNKLTMTLIRQLNAISVFFWKLIKRNKTVSSKIYPEIIQDDNICNTPESIANAFMDYFSKLYQPDSDEMYDNDTRQQIELDYNKILKSCYEQNVYLPGGIIKESEVDGIIKLLKRRKASGHDKIQHDHLLCGGHTLVRCLTSLFNLVVSKGRAPNGWKLGLVSLFHYLKATINRRLHRTVTDQSRYFHVFSKCLSMLLSQDCCYMSLMEVSFRTLSSKAFRNISDVLLHPLIYMKLYFIILNYLVKFL
ncbi:Hypothetical predicted protein [Mytilus galloprovincialis]|uniref:Uncharacterized protein n=1 Tax=Mytilus galloprovincialis TaxID=29158 RepID=A0A8B6EGA2_MYTGA|nr:Hypothetical predicted protein [Mytilus galloprovincialis]